MPRIELPGAAAVEGAGRLLDLCDEAHLPIGFSCRTGRCATCRVNVADGAELLDPPSAAEQETLGLHRSKPDQRLACQVSVRPEPGLVRLRWAPAVGGLRGLV
jgi:adenylate cyclase